MRLRVEKWEVEEVEEDGVLDTVLDWVSPLLDILERQVIVFGILIISS